MANGLQTGMGSEPSEWVTSMLCVLPCTHSSEAWKDSLAAGSGLTTFVLMNQSPWCPASCFQTPLDCSLEVGEITEGAAESNPALTLEMLPSPLFSWLVHFPVPGNSRPVSVALLHFACSLSNVLRSLCSYAVVRIRLIPICYTREEEFCFLI